MHFFFIIIIIFLGGGGLRTKTLIIFRGFLKTLARYALFFENKTSIIFRGFLQTRNCQGYHGTTILLHLDVDQQNYHSDDKVPVGLK